MARPRVFISSTFYDLKYIRASLENFIKSLGYESILSEKGQIAYDPDFPLDESCYREAASADIFVLIVGGRYGSETSEESLETKPGFYDRYESITKKELDSAAERDVPIYILIERVVMGEYKTYLKNKKRESMEYAHVQSANVFHLIEHIMAKRRNNPIQEFGQHSEIEDWLKEQWAGLFREMIVHRSEQKQIASLSERVDELASINTSLQRYLEVVLKNVDKEKGDELVKKEQARQIEAKQLRDFKKNSIVYNLTNYCRIPLNEVRKIIEDSKTLDDIASEIRRLVGFHPKQLVALFNNNFYTLENANLARKCLDLPPLVLSSNTSTQASTKQETNKKA
jgi:uncharacterized protein DUF4062